MVKIVRGDRIGLTASLSIGCSALIFDAAREKILLTRRQDNGRWCLPGGRVESGESVAEACIRETLEETGLAVSIKRLIGIYSSPDMILEYADGNRYHLIAHSFEVEIIGGILGLSAETTETGYFSPAEITSIDLMEHHRQRIQDALAEQAAAFIR